MISYRLTVFPADLSLLIQPLFLLIVSSSFTTRNNCIQSKGGYLIGVTGTMIIYQALFDEILLSNYPLHKNIPSSVMLSLLWRKWFPTKPPRTLRKMLCGLCVFVGHTPIHD
jgi:hypothetical protein